MCGARRLHLPGHPKEEFILFVRPRDPERETWTGRRAGVEGAIETYGAQMAYTIDRFVRTADQVVQELRVPAAVRGARPRPCHKHVWAEMTQVAEGETHNGRVALFAHLAAQRQRRDPSGDQPTALRLGASCLIAWWWKLLTPKWV